MNAMKLKKYIQSIPVSKRDNFAQRCGTTFNHLRNVAYGYKLAGESLCINIERESGGIVRCEEMRQDVDWNFIRGTSKQENPREVA